MSFYFLIIGRHVEMEGLMPMISFLCPMGSIPLNYIETNWKISPIFPIRFCCQL